MKSLLDISTLVALIIEGHEFNQRANDWLSGKKLALCAISELGFLRVAALAYGVELSAAREALQQFKADHKPEFLPCDVSALQGREWAIFDRGILEHVISSLLAPAAVRQIKNPPPFLAVG